MKTSYRQNFEFKNDFRSNRFVFLNEGRAQEQLKQPKFSEKAGDDAIDAASKDYETAKNILEERLKKYANKTPDLRRIFKPERLERYSREAKSILASSKENFPSVIELKRQYLDIDKKTNEIYRILDTFALSTESTNEADEQAPHAPLDVADSIIGPEKAKFHTAANQILTDIGNIKEFNNNPVPSKVIDELLASVHKQQFIVDNTHQIADINAANQEINQIKNTEVPKALNINFAGILAENVFASKVEDSQNKGNPYLISDSFINNFNLPQEVAKYIPNGATFPLEAGGYRATITNDGGAYSIQFDALSQESMKKFPDLALQLGFKAEEYPTNPTEVAKKGVPLTPAQKIDFSTDTTAKVRVAADNTLIARRPDPTPQESPKYRPVIAKGPHLPSQL